LAQHSKVKVWIAENVDVEEKPVLAVVGVQRKHPIAESGKKYPNKSKDPSKH
jgi:hypothetical protein